MYDYINSLVCFQELTDTVNVSKFNEHNYALGTCQSIDDLPIRVSLWRKHNLIVHNFTLEIKNNMPVIYCDLAGKEQDLNTYFEDVSQNYKYYLQPVKDLFDNGLELTPTSEADKKREVLEKTYSNHQKRKKYNAKTHKFEEGYVSNNQEQ